MRLVLLALLLAACGQAVHSEPGIKQYGVTDGTEPTVRVYLRSLGDWKTLQVRGKGGLRVTTRDADFATEAPYTLARTSEAVWMRPIENVVTVGDRNFSGELVWTNGYLINRVSLENYLLGVLRGELPLRRVPRQAAAAQAIAARSYTLYYLARDREDYDVDDTTLFQRYVGLKYAPDDGNLRAGVQGTIGLYLAYEGAPLKAYYHSTCGGHTTDVETGLDRAPVAPMSGVECEWCKGTKYWRWNATVPDELVLRAASLSGPLERVDVVERGAGDRAREVMVVAGGGTKRMPASQLRLAVGASKLRSTKFDTVEETPDGLRVTGGGWGHGVGLCQMGAIGMARQGRSGIEIASYYYRGATIRRAY